MAHVIAPDVRFWMRTRFPPQMCPHCDRLCMMPGCKACVQVNRSKNA